MTQEVQTDRAGHCPVSLEDWLAACAQAGTPAVPAEHLINISLSDLMEYDVPGEHRSRLEESIRQIREGLKPGYMLRYDCCAPMEVKRRLANGQWQLHPDMLMVDIDDPRLWDTAIHYPRRNLPVWQRPWVKARIEAGFPVEYRVYVDNGKIQGISNYYPQRQLAENNAELQQVRDLTQLLINTVNPPYQWPLTPEVLRLELEREQYDQAGPHFTADFIVTSEGQALFLEGGPPHCLGSHPCCFRPGEIHGVALKDRNQTPV